MPFLDIKKQVPLAYIKDTVIFPDVLVELYFANEPCQLAAQSAGEGGELVVVTQKHPDNLFPASSDLFNVGVIGKIIEISRDNDRLKVVFEPKTRVRIIHYLRLEPFFLITFRNINDDKRESDQVLALRTAILENVRKLINLHQAIPLEMAVRLFSMNNQNQLINTLLAFLPVKILDKQEILETIAIEDRSIKTNKLVSKTIKVAQLEQEVTKKTEEELSKTQKEVFLREEMKAIQNELGEGVGSEFDELRRKIENSQMPLNVREIAYKELNRLEKSPSFSPEVSYIRNYLDWLVSMPWRSLFKQNIDLREAAQILDLDHYGLKNVKDRVLEFLAVQKNVGKIKGPILCFVGPPGTGKTSIGKSIAKALKRKFVRVSLGGIRDESEIRGHRRTYVGALPGRIIQGIANAGERNPVFMLDEIDKIGTDFRGDPSAALLETLDPEQNANFSDHYLEVPFDLSDVMFITTANVLENIPSSLRDRMEVIDFPGYSINEKSNIVKKFIWPKILLTHGLADKNIFLQDDAISEIIEKHTQEAGVRNLEREISKIARKMAWAISIHDDYTKRIDKKEVTKILGQPIAPFWVKEWSDQVGLVAALAVTEIGGQILSVEASFIPGGHGNLILTGNLGEVMKESAQAALSYTRGIARKYGIEASIFSTHDIHVHVPSGAIPKDGPSAGVAIALGIISAITDRKIGSDVGVTGEITLRGRILRVGGIKEKILAAKRMGLKQIILPGSNYGDWQEVDPDYRDGLDFIFAENVGEILPKVLS